MTQHEEEEIRKSHSKEERTNEQATKLLEEGYQDVKGLKFERRLKPSEDKIGYEGLRLANAALYSQRSARTKGDMAGFVDLLRNKNILAKISAEEREDFIFTTVYNNYLNDRFGMGDTLMSSLHLSELQQKNLSKLILMESMTTHTDIDGVFAYTATKVARRVLKFYPEFAEEPEVREQAKKAFIIEISELSSFGSNMLAATDAYLEMGLVSLADVIENDQQLVNTVEQKARRALQSGDVKIAATLRNRYIPEDSEFWTTDEVQASAEHGFRKELTTYPDPSGASDIVEAFLPEDFLEDEKIKEFITEKYKESLKNGQFGSAVEFVATLADQIPENLTDERIWESDLSEPIKEAFRAKTKDGWGRGVLDFKRVFTLPEDLQAENIKEEIIQGLKQHLKYESMVDESAEIVECFDLDSEVWEEVITPDLLMKIYNREDYYDRTRFILYIREAKKRGIEPKASEETLKEFLDLFQAQEPVLNGHVLSNIISMVKAQPDLLSHMNMEAGENFPQGATLKRLIDYSNNNSLKTNSIVGLYMFTMDEVEELSALLDRDLPKGYTSLETVTFFNILKEDFLKKVDNEQKEKIINWARRWGNEARQVLEEGDSRENVLLAKPHWTRYAGKSKDESVADVAENLIRNKAHAFAEALDIMNDPEKIDEVGEFIDKQDPNKLYLVGRKKMYHMLQGHFKDIHFPDFHW